MRFVLPAQLFLLAVSAVSAVSAVATAADRPYGLVVGCNTSLDPDVAALRYADDDAVQNAMLLRQMGAEVVLLTQMDPDTFAQQPDLPHVPPTLENLEKAMDQLNLLMAKASSEGETPVLYFFYSGHGEVENNEGYVNLAGEKLFRGTLMDLLRRSRASRNHVLIDACKSYFLVFDRGAGGQHSLLMEPLQVVDRAKLPPNTGVFLSTSSAADSHEWEALQAGIFSHELRSALRGAADLNNDALITYEEAAAFIWNANAGIDNPRFRPRFYSSAPGWRVDADGQVLFDLRQAPSDRLTVRSPRPRHWFIEDAKGRRLMDFHPAPEVALVLQIPPARPLFVQDPTGSEEFEIPPGPEVDLASLKPAERQVRNRGALHLAFRALFDRPFGPQSLVAYREKPAEVSVTVPADKTRWVRWGLGISSLAFLAAGGTMTALALGERSRLMPTTSALETGHINDRISTYNRVAVGMYAAGAVALTSFLVWTLWPDREKELPLVILPTDTSILLLMRW